MPNNKSPPQKSGYDPDGVLRRLTPQQQQRLAHIRSEIRVDKVVVSFSIEGRGLNGRRTAFYSASSLRAHGADGEPQVYTEPDAKVVACLLSKHVVGITYGDAVRRRILTPAVARDELAAILRAYDDRLVALLGSESPAETRTPNNGDVHG